MSIARPPIRPVAFAFLGAILVSLAACSHGHRNPEDPTAGTESPSTPPPPHDVVSIEAKQAAAEAGTSTVTEVRFPKRSARLSDVESKRVRDLCIDATRRSPIRRAMIVAWSDSEMPDKKGAELSENDIALARARAEAVELVLHRVAPGARTKIVNMAEKSGKLENFLKTQNARVKESFELAGTPHAGKVEEAKKDGSTAKASHAIVILTLQEKVNEKENENRDRKPGQRPADDSVDE